MQARRKQDCGRIPKEDTHVWKGGREVVVMVPPLDSMGSETLRARAPAKPVVLGLGGPDPGEQMRSHWPNT